MQPTAHLCRTREAFELRRAENAPLGNVRLVAQNAAAAWRKEAVFAEGREFRLEQLRLVRADACEQARLAGDALDRCASENPDRGQAGTLGRDDLGLR